jgi:hypothetical protein
MRAEIADRETVVRYPIRGIFVGCCARAGKGRAKSIEQKVRRVILLCMGFPSIASALTLALSQRAREKRISNSFTSLDDFRALLVQKLVAAIGAEELDLFVPKLVPVAIELALALWAGHPKNFRHGSSW